METKPFYPCPVSDQGKPVNNCAPDRIIWENEMLKSVWAAGLHDEANCFEDTLREKRILENRERMRKEVPQTNADRIRAMTDEALAEELADYLCNKIQDIGLCEKYEECGQGCFMDYLRSPVEECHE